MSIMKTLTINGTKYNVTPVVPADSVTLRASAWVSDGDAYSQVVEIPGVTPHTKVDLQPTSEQLVEFHYKVLAFVAENSGGTVAVYAIGDKPANDHTIQITKTEVEGTGKIRGNTVGTSMPRPDWNQTDPTKADYILNKPGLSHVNATFDSIGMTLDNDFDEIVSAIRDGKIVTLSNTNPVGNESVYYCTHYDIGYESVEHLEFIGHDFGKLSTISVYADGRITKKVIDGNGGGSVELDTTLSVSGKAADAKAVGDAIGDIESALDGIIEIQNSLIGGDGA